MVQGVFRLATAFASNVDGRSWLVLSALVTLVLGIMIFAQWPAASLWVIGLFVGIDFLIYGSWLVSLAFAVRRRRRRRAKERWPSYGRRLQSSLSSQRVTPPARSAPRSGASQNSQS